MNGEIWHPGHVSDEMAEMQTLGRDGVRLWWEERGSGVPVLLVPGRGDSADLYPGEFVERLASAGCRVLRFDPRDTGLSGDGGGAYTLVDMADDALAVLDASGTRAAHLVGLSMAGLLLVDIATRAPDRLLSLTFLSAVSPDPGAGIGPDFFDMMGDDPVATIVGAMSSPTDADRAWVEREVAESERRAARRPEAGARHQESALRSPWPAQERLADIAVPCLVLHGACDPKLPLAHAEAFRDGISGSHLIVLDGMGHLPRPAEWDRVADLFLDYSVRSVTPKGHERQAPRS